MSFTIFDQIRSLLSFFDSHLSNSQLSSVLTVVVACQALGLCHVIRVFDLPQFKHLCYGILAMDRVKNETSESIVKIAKFEGVMMLLEWLN